MVLLATLNYCTFKTTEPILKVRHALERGDPNSFISGIFCSKIFRCPTKKWWYIIVKSRKSAFTALPLILKQTVHPCAPVSGVPSCVSQKHSRALASHPSCVLAGPDFGNIKTLIQTFGRILKI